MQELGRGTMGQVYPAHDRLLDRLVAIKFVDAREVGEGARERFYAEARAVARLSHPNIVAVYRIGEVQRRPYLVSEYVCGPSLDRLPRPLRWERVLAIGLGLARGLAAAHDGGVLHCDIKPANAVLGIGDVAKLIDFGLVLLLDAGPPRVPGAHPLPAALEHAQLSATVSMPGRAPDDGGRGPMRARGQGRPGRRRGRPAAAAPSPARRSTSPRSCGAASRPARAATCTPSACSCTSWPAAAPRTRACRSSISPAARCRRTPRRSPRALSLPAELASLIDACVGRDPARRPERADALCAMLEAVARTSLPRWT